MTKPLLVEIVVEELPAIPFLKELPNIEKKWLSILEQNNLVCEFDFFYTPRRLVFWHREFKIAQDDKQIENWGAPKNIAFKDDKPTGAAHGFAKKCNITLDEIEINTRNNQEFLYYKNEQKGKKARELLNDMVNDFIKSLNFGKSMRWGDKKESFIRPIRGLSIVLGDELIDGELYGVKSSKSSFGHRMVSYDKFSFDFAGDYFCKLDKNGVILYPSERKKIILEKITKIEKEHNVNVEIDEELLDELVAITEYPTALIGKFDEEFLELPKEVIIGSMKEHQRYFAVYKDGKITNNFIVVSNAFTKDFTYVVSGNEKVLRPRLADGMFFYKNDIKNGLNNDGLKQISYVDGLGSVYDKTLRETKIALYLADKFGLTNATLLEEAMMLSKADLLTDMVYEFTDLQGLMGYYYAKIEQKDPLVRLALKEQYLPLGEDSLLPSNLFSSIVAISSKLDTIMGLFSIDMIPTGSRDPFALRRAALGIFKICKEHELTLDLNELIEYFSDSYKKLNKDQIIEFVSERLYKFYNDTNPSIIKAVLNSTSKNDLYNIGLKIEALNPIVNSSDFKNINDTFKRVANIVKDIEQNVALDVDEKLFEDTQEKELFKAYNSVVSKEYLTYDEELEALFSLKPLLDDFFDNVFVNHKDENIKNNRKNLIGTVYNSFKNIADIKEITI